VVLLEPRDKRGPDERRRAAEDAEDRDAQANRVVHGHPLITPILPHTPGISWRPWQCRPAGKLDLRFRKKNNHRLGFDRESRNYRRATCLAARPVAELGRSVR